MRDFDRKSNTYLVHLLAFLYYFFIKRIVWLLILIISTRSIISLSNTHLILFNLREEEISFVFDDIQRIILLIFHKKPYFVGAH